MVSIRRISGRRVPPLADPTRVRLVVMGEAPGPLGADVTLHPFWGDRAGRLVYRALASCGCASWPGDASVLMLPGHALVTAGVYPVVRDVWLTNAWDRCPTDDHVRFRAPRLAELRSTANARRLRREWETAAGRGARHLVALGRVAGLVAHAVPASWAVYPLPHPSAQGLLQSAPDRGRGCRLADLETAWVEQFAAVVRRIQRMAR